MPEFPIRRSTAVAVGRRPSSADAVLAGALAAGAAVESFVTDTNRPPWLHAVLSVTVAVALVWRGRHPLTVLGLVVTGTVVIDPSGHLSVFAMLVVASFTAGMELDPPRSWLGLALAVVPFWAWYAVHPAGAVSDFVAVAILYGGSWAVGQAVRDRTHRAAEAAARAERAEQGKEADARRAVADERARIARELHDVVSHSISVITVQTQAVRRRLGPEHTREADDLRAVEATARQAMAEMRRLFGVLRADGERPALAPQPGLDQLERLLADTRAAGVPVTTAIEGRPVPLPPGLDLTAYRIVQEALTNVRKHAPGGQVTVRLCFGERDLDVVVEDTGGAAPPAAGASGFGLVGMRERVGLYGGIVHAGPMLGGGFAVRARLPLREGASA